MNPNISQNSLVDVFVISGQESDFEERISQFLAICGCNVINLMNPFIQESIWQCFFHSAFNVTLRWLNLIFNTYNFCRVSYWFCKVEIYIICFIQTLNTLQKKFSTSNSTCWVSALLNCKETFKLKIVAVAPKFMQKLLNFFFNLLSSSIKSTFFMNWLSPSINFILLLVFFRLF